MTLDRREFLACAGLPGFDAPAAAPSEFVDRAVEPPPPPPDDAPPLLALICTRSHLAYAEVASSSFRRRHPHFRHFLLLVDGDEADRGVLDGATVSLLSDLRLPDGPWLTVKLDANELSNALKPVFLEHLAAFGRRAIYLDCDIAVFGRLDAMLQALDAASLVLTPHMTELFPRPEMHWITPSNADIFNAGLINAGCFAIDLCRARRFLAFWREANLTYAWAPGGARQTDQQFLNWALILCDDVAVLRDKTYNVAYWNLHERSLRHVGSADEEPVFEVDGGKLTLFHFSGYDPADVLRLSRHDQRYAVYTLPSVAVILEWYSARLHASRHAPMLHARSAFDRLANGVRVTPLLRELFKRYERYAPRVDASTAQGADALCRFLMRPLPSKGSRLPLIAAEIYDLRPDLQESFPDAHTDLNPVRFWKWFCQHAGVEFDIEPLIAGFRRVLESDSIAGFTASIAATVPAVAGLKMLGSDRRFVADELSAHGRPDMAEVLLSGETEWFFFSDFSAVLALYAHRQDLRKSFPDPFGASHAELALWLREHGTAEHGLSVAATEEFADKSAAQVLARVFSFLSRREDVAAIALETLLSDDPRRLVRALMRDAGEGLEFDLADIEAFCFIHRFDRRQLVPLYLELPAVRRRSPNSRSEAGRIALLPVPAELDWVAAGCRLHAACFPPAEAALEDEIRSLYAEIQATGQDVMSVLKASRLEVPASKLARIAEQRARRRPGAAEPGPDAAAGTPGVPAINVFGYFFADTGVGESSRGLSRALSLVSKVRRAPQFTGHLERKAVLAELFTRFDHHADHNLFVSYPHALEDLFGLMPPAFTERRRNIVHLAWEQRDWNTHWRSIYRRYDEIWSISDFAAQPFREMFGPEKVRVVPNVLLVDGYPPGDEAAALRFTRPVFRFLFVFDANSSIERKNPEAVLRAFAAAFAGTSRAGEVELVLKVNNLDRAEHVPRVTNLRRMAAASGLPVTFDGRRLERREVLKLIASADCYVSLHRAEGFGYTMAEAMYYGVPVIASGYSGNLEYMTEENSYLVPCRETLVRLGDGPFQRGSVWAEPDVDVAASMMRWIVENRDATRVVGQRGASDVRAKLLPERVAETLRPFFDVGAGAPAGRRRQHV